MSSNLHSVTLRYSAWFLYVITEQKNLTCCYQWYLLCWQNGNAAIHEAAWHGYSRTLDVLIKHDCNIVITNKVTSAIDYTSDYVFSLQSYQWRAAWNYTLRNSQSKLVKGYTPTHNNCKKLSPLCILLDQFSINRTISPKSQ